MSSKEMTISFCLVEVVLSIESGVTTNESDPLPRLPKNILMFS